MRRPNRIGPVPACLFFGLLLGGTLGCGGSEPYDLQRVSGRLVYEDAALRSAARIQVVFTPQAEPVDPRTHPRPGQADVDVASGTFSSATTHKVGDGLVVGQHKVRVFAYDERGNPTEYAATPSEIDVGAGSKAFEFRVKSP